MWTCCTHSSLGAVCEITIHSKSFESLAQSFVAKWSERVPQLTSWLSKRLQLVESIIRMVLGHFDMYG